MKFTDLFGKTDKAVALELVQLSSLKPYKKNARTHSEDQIAQLMASIKEFGFRNPVLIDQHSNVIAGHGRVEAARRLGIDRLPCIRHEDMTDAQKRAYVIADNKIALNAGWDMTLLGEELFALSDDSFDLKLLGFSADELTVAMYPELDRGPPPEPAGKKKKSCPHCGGDL